MLHHTMGMENVSVLLLSLAPVLSGPSCGANLPHIQSIVGQVLYEVAFRILGKYSSLYLEAVFCTFARGHPNFQSGKTPTGTEPYPAGRWPVHPDWQLTALHRVSDGHVSVAPRRAGLIRLDTWI